MIPDKYKIFYDHIVSNQYRSILVLDGDLPEKSFFESGLPIIAADGAMNALHLLGITPKVVVGDLDSVNPALLTHIEVVHKPDQNSCDFEKALLFLEEKHLLPAIIVGINGGYIDHILNNINIFLQQGCVFYAPPIVGYTLEAGKTHAFSLPLHTKISLMGFPNAQVSTQGLQWELQDYQMSFPGQNSCFNRTGLECIDITVHSGLILVLIYLD